MYEQPLPKTFGTSVVPLNLADVDEFQCSTIESHLRGNLGRKPCAAHDGPAILAFYGGVEPNFDNQS